MVKDSAGRTRSDRKDIGSQIGQGKIVASYVPSEASAHECQF
jgi:hypothetical protein